MDSILTSIAPPKTEAKLSGAILLVDDEPNILTSLKRLLRPMGLTVWTAENGTAGLEIFAREKIDIVISDMRMPEMSGVQFLQRVRERNPEAIRILLTGYADVSSTIDAINKGEIYRYISKPWDDREVLMIIHQVMDTKRLKEEKHRLEELVQQQNEELKQLNNGLEQKVQERTQALQKAMSSLEKAHFDLKKNFFTSIKVFSNLIEMREGGMAGHARRVADLSRSLALHIKLSEGEAQDVFLAALLHNIGKIGLSDTILKKPYVTLSPAECDQVHKHPIKGQTVLMALDQLSDAAVLIRHHRERFDGQGYPDGLVGLAIPTGARIISIASDYDALLSATLNGHKYNQEEALNELCQSAAKRYDPLLLKKFIEMLGLSVAKPVEKDRKVLSEELEPGMVLSRDLVTRDGALLLAKDFVIEPRIIKQIRHYEAVEDQLLQIFIHERK